MKYSTNSIILMILLGIRVIGQALILPFFGISTQMILLSAIFALAYTIAFFGILKKTNWGLILTIIIATIDLIISIDSIYFNFSAIIVTSFC